MLSVRSKALGERPVKTQTQVASPTSPCVRVERSGFDGVAKVLLPDVQKFNSANQAGRLDDQVRRIQDHVPVGVPLWGNEFSQPLEVVGVERRKPSTCEGGKLSGSGSDEAVFWRW